MARSRNGVCTRSSRQTSAPAASGTAAASSHAGSVEAESKKPRMASIVTANSATPGKSSELSGPPGARWAGVHGAYSSTAAWRGRYGALPAGAVTTYPWSGGSQRSAAASPATVSGMLTTNTARQPAADTRKPPRTGPNAALLALVTEMAASAAAGGFGVRASRRIIASPAGYAADVPAACTIRQASTHQKPGATAASTPVTNTTASPVQYTRRGPNRSAMRPINGWPTHAVR